MPDRWSAAAPPARVPYALRSDASMGRALGLGRLHGLRERACAGATHPVFAVGRPAEGIRGLGMLRKIEPRHLVVLRDAQAHDRVEHLEDHERHHETQAEGCRDGHDLFPELPGLAVEKTVRAAL